MADAPYTAYADYLARRHGCRVYRVAVDAGFSCPHRPRRPQEGEEGGCIYCDAGGSRAPYLGDLADLRKQIRTGVSFLRARYRAEAFALYFQAYTGTNAPVDRLASIYDAGLAQESFVELIVSTRSDCVDEEKAGYARFYIAKAYENMGNYDEAKKHYTVFVEEYPHLNPQYLAAAQATLADISVLKKLATGNEPIPFAVSGLDGKRISLDDYKGKVVLLDFWSIYCVSCIQEMPSLVALYDKYKDQGFVTYGVDLDSFSPKRVERFIKGLNFTITYPVIIDRKRQIATAFKVGMLPTTIIIGKDGKVKLFHIGYKPGDEDEFDHLIKTLLK